MDHCIAKITSIIDQNESSNRALFQLGYNLGRLSELTGLGREAFWDRWKVAVDQWDHPKLAILAQELLQSHGIAQSSLATDLTKLA